MKMIYYVEGGVRNYWFKTQKGAENFASKKPGRKVKTPTTEIGIEWGKKQLKMANRYDELVIIPLKLMKGEK